VNTEAQRVAPESDHGLIPDLRDVPLAVLAARAADGTDAVNGVISRILHDPESPSGIPAMMFNSAI
jgi:hypothetical protein